MTSDERERNGLLTQMRQQTLRTTPRFQARGWWRAVFIGGGQCGTHEVKIHYR